MGAPRGKRTGSPKRAIAVRLDEATIAWLERRAKAAEVPLATLAATVIVKVHENHIKAGAPDA